MAMGNLDRLEFGERAPKTLGRAPFIVVLRMKYLSVVGGGERERSGKQARVVFMEFRQNFNFCLFRK